MWWNRPNITKNEFEQIKKEISDLRIKVEENDNHLILFAEKIKALKKVARKAIEEEVSLRTEEEQTDTNQPTPAELQQWIMGLGRQQ